MSNFHSNNAKAPYFLSAKYRKKTKVYVMKTKTKKKEILYQMIELKETPKN